MSFSISDKLKYCGKKVLITGGLGFIGSNLAIGLHKAGANVHLLSSSWPANDSHLAPVLKEMKFWQCDLSKVSKVQTIVENVEVIFNLAAKSGAAASNQCPHEDLDMNCRTQLVFLEACRLSNPGVKIIFTSSRLVYDPNASLPVTESAPTDPISLYGVHKLTVEKYHQIYAHIHGIKSAIFRITNPYGPYQQPDRRGYGIINWFIQSALAGGDLPVYGDGKQVRDYIYIDDVVDALMLAGIHSRPGHKVYNLASGVKTRFIDMAETIIRIAGSGKLKHIEWPETASKIETGDFEADINLINKDFGWQPQVSLNDGIANVIAFYKNETRSIVK